MCTASARSSSRASSSSCTSSIAEEDSELSDGGDEFVPPRQVTVHKTAQPQRQWGMDETARRKPVLKPTTPRYLPKSPKTVGREPPLSSTAGWRTRPQRDSRPDTTVTLDSGLLSPGGTRSQVPRIVPTTPTNTGVFKVPRTPPVSSSRPKDAGSRMPKMVDGGEDRSGVDGAGVSRPATAIGTSTETEVTRAATPPPHRLHSSSSDMALSATGSASSTRTQSRIPTRTGARQPQRGTGASSRGSSPGSIKWFLLRSDNSDYSLYFNIFSWSQHCNTFDVNKCRSVSIVHRTSRCQHFPLSTHERAFRLALSHILLLFLLCMQLLKFRKIQFSHFINFLSYSNYFAIRLEQCITYSSMPSLVHKYSIRFLYKFFNI